MNHGANAQSARNSKDQERFMKTSQKVVAKQPVAASKPKKAKVAKLGAPIAHAVGRRKSAVARVWLRRGKGEITVNGRPANQYFDTDFHRAEMSLPASFAAVSAMYDVEATVQGGGSTGQAGAVKLGIARALVTTDESMKAAMKKYKLLTVDSRVKERKKYGQKAARRKFQFVKR